MYKEGHSGVTLLLSGIFIFPLISLGFPILAVAFVVSAFITTAIPDWDMRWQQERTILHKIPLLRSLLPTIKHRGITHTIWFGIVIGLITLAASILLILGLDIAYDNQLLMAIIISFGSMMGIYFHILGDIITPTGINPIYPYELPERYNNNNGRFSIYMTYASNTYANTLFVLIGITYISISFIVSLNILFNNISTIIATIIFLSAYILLTLLFWVYYNKKEYIDKKVYNIPGI